MEVSCDWVKNNYEREASRQAVGAHLSQCRNCQAMTYDFFQGLRSRFDYTLKTFAHEALVFRRNIAALSRNSDQPGTVDPSTGLLLDLCDQLTEDARTYYSRYPHNSCRALGWLQKAFFVCRALESERLVEQKGRTYRVGDKEVPDGGGRRWKDVTSPSTMYKANLNYGTFMFNRELHDRISEALNSGDYVDALKLICDSPKHGVMSSLLNVMCFMHIEHIYILGFKAAIMALHSFIQYVDSDELKAQAS